MAPSSSNGEGTDKEGAAGRVLVFARSRPFLGREGGDLQAVHMESEDNNVVVSTAPDAMSCLHAKEEVQMERTDKRYKFDGAFDEEASQKEVFQRVGLPVLVEVMKGFNGCIFAYGQTGSGKTHSLLNTEVAEMEDVGILPRLVATLFARAAMDKKFVYSIKCAGFQVYNEQVDDLLHPEHKKGKGVNLSIAKGGSVQDLTWSECKTPASMLDAFKRARAQLHYAETKMNKSSSRSHAVFQVRIIRRARVGKNADGTQQQQSGSRMKATMGQMSVVDLAGSERVKRSGVTGSNFKEATNINGSLLALGNVIQALADKRTHVPFRDSKLTRILEGSVGGNCKTSLLVCVSPAETSTSETLSTLEFASRAMRVEVDARVNETVVELDADLLAADMEENDGAGYVDEEMLKTFKESESALAAAKALAAEQEQAQAELKAKVGEMSRSAAEKEKALMQLTKEGKKQMSQIEELKSTLTADAARHAKETEASKRAMGALHEQVARAEKEVAQTKTALKQLTQQHAVEQKARASAEKKVKELTEQAKANENKAKAALVASQSATAETKEKLEKESKARATEAAELRATISAEQAKAKALDVRIAELDGQKSDLSTELGTLKNQLSSTRGMLSQENLKVEKLTVIQEEARVLQEQLESSRAAEAQLKAQVSGLELDKQALNTTLAGLSHKYDTLKDEFQRESVLRQALQEDKRALESDKAQLQTDLASEKAALEESKALMTATEQAHCNATAQLKEDHANHVANVQATAQQSAEKQAQHAAEALQALETRAQKDSEKLTEKVRAIETQKAEAEAAHKAKVAKIIEQHKIALSEALDAERAVHDKQCLALRAQIDQAVAATVASEEQGLQREKELTNQHETKVLHARCGAAAARAAMAMDRSKLEVEHRKLAARFAARESRKEDLKLIAAQQKDINEMKQTVKNIKKAMKQKQLELEHVVDNVRIFGTQYDRPGNPTTDRVLPGKRVNERGSFIERKSSTPMGGSQRRIPKQGSFQDPIFNPVHGVSRPNTAAGLLPTRRTETPTPGFSNETTTRLDSPPRLSSASGSQRRSRPLPTPPVFN